MTWFEATLDWRDVFTLLDVGVVALTILCVVVTFAIDRAEEHALRRLQDKLRTFLGGGAR